MKRIFIILLSLIFVLTGCLPNFNKKQTNNNQVNQPLATTTTKTIDTLVTTTLTVNQPQDNLLVATSNNKREIKRFYPDNDSTNSTNKKSSTLDDQEKSFTITPELIAKMYLIEKYNPGVCFGMPSPVPQSGIDYLINNNKPLADFVRQRYHLSSDLEVYNKLKQFQNIQLNMIASSKYKFQFMDGQCCTLTFYQGTIEVKGDRAIEIIENKETKNNPC